MFCSNCGKEIGEGMAFCQHCGSPVSTPKETTADSLKNTAGSLFRSFQGKAKSVSESINAAAEESQKKSEQSAKNNNTNTKGSDTKKLQSGNSLRGRFITQTFSNGISSLSGMVIVDRLTGVNYLLAREGMSDVSGLTVLVDENGKPLVTKEDKIETDTTEDN